MDESNDFISSVAVIGIAGRFPGADSVDRFWQNLSNGVESILRLSEEELLRNGENTDHMVRPNYVKAGTLFENPDMFDADFFGYTRREAELMDPQQRVFLETAWTALESAGYNPETYAGIIGLFAGASTNDYRKQIAADRQSPTSDINAFQVMTSNDADFLSTRVSYKLNFKGPSLTLQTACSTSLVAVHYACQGLLTYQCDMALAGGVCIRFPQGRGYLFQEGMIWSPDGHCRAFDAEANGTVFGHGVGIVVLKRLSDAIENGDNILAVIKGSAVNNDGAAKVGFTAPSIDGQAEVIAMAQAIADVGADTIDYIEAHGTGTSLGDPIEIEALTQAFEPNTSKKGYCAIGSVKTNIGHLDIAAGIAGLIKTVLSLHHKKIPPSLHFHTPNPKIDFENSPFFVNNQLRAWQKNGHPRRAGVSAFGIGGTNAHVVLEEASEVNRLSDARPWQLILLSAKTQTALERTTDNMVDHLQSNPEQRLSDVAFTLQVGRKHFHHRRMAVCRNVKDAVNALSQRSSSCLTASSHKFYNRNVIFIFSGQGSQYVTMGRDLYQTEPVFKKQVDDCAKILKPHLGIDLREILYPAKENIEYAEKELSQTYITQPALFVIESALAKLWEAWGIKPFAMVGHSIGEYVAAHFSGVFSLEDVLHLVALRGRLMQALPKGAMLAVPLSESQIQPYLNKNLSLAVINGPALCVVSGDGPSIEDLKNHLSDQKITSRTLRTSHAFHSYMMDPIIETYTQHLQKISRQKPQIPFLSNVSGTWISPQEAMAPSYWASHLRQTVRYNDCLIELYQDPNTILLEVGPGSIFSNLARQHPSKKKEHVILSSNRRPNENKNDLQHLLTTLGQLWLSGTDIDWSGFHANEHHRRIPLPTYPFQRQRYWITDGLKTNPEADCLSFASSYEHPSDIKTSIAPGIHEKPEDKSKIKYSDDIEQTLINIWKALIGIFHVDIHDNFFDLGGSSLTAVNMVVNIEEIFHKKFPASILYDAPTIKELADVIRNNDMSTSWPSLVKIKPGNGSRPPFFCIHGAGGNVLLYKDLAKHLPSEQPFYGLQAQGINGRLPIHGNIEEMASHYVSEIKTIQPNGPYFFRGILYGRNGGFRDGTTISSPK